MATKKIEAPVVLSTDEVRAGVTGHHVRYVLAFGLLGSLIAFLIIGLYYGLGGLTQAIAELFGGEGTLARRLVVIVVPLAYCGRDRTYARPVGTWFGDGARSPVKR